jgi:type IV secretion system protein TrbD
MESFLFYLIMSLKRVPIFKSGVRPHLFLGGDRELVLFSGLIAAVLIFGCLRWETILTGLALWSAALCVFRHMAKADPLMRRIYLRHRLYHRYYPARSRPYRINKVTRMTQSSAFSK